jgi:HEAT repeat protein
VSIRFKAGVFSLVAGFLFSLGTLANGQEPILNSYQRNFMRASLSTKAGILRDAATDDRASEFIGQLYEYALNFSLQNVEILWGDPDLINLTVIASRGVGAGGYTQSVDSLWRVFSSFRDSQARIAALDALAVLGKGNAQVVENLNQFLANQNSLYRSGIDVDIPTLSACISTLSALGDDSSFPVLFAALTVGYPDPVGPRVADALEGFPGDHRANLVEILRKNPPGEKLAVFRAGIASSRMTTAEKGAFAEIALEIGMETESANPDGDVALTVLRSLAVRALTDLKWSGASPEVVKYFYRTQTTYQETRAIREQERLLEAISCLGVMNSPDAVQALSLQLGFINSQFERTKKDGNPGEFDEPVMLAVINALGQLRDKGAFDALHYVGYLDYPERVKAAAREALNNLQW